MKASLFFVLLIFPVISYGANCTGGAGKNHTNMDGSFGGYVANTASVAKTVHLDASSSVCEMAKVQGNVKISKNSIVSGSASIEGNVQIQGSRIKGTAKIYGNAVITNSKICQASEINRNVSNSDYYCEMYDEEPRDPGEAGLKTILGIDSDADGVRDDVEIWINSVTTNTAQKDKYNIRQALIQIAKNLRKANKLRENKEESIRYTNEALYGLECLRQFTTEDEYEELRAYLYARTYCTKDRLLAWAKIEGNRSGQGLQPKRKENCEFKIR